MACIENRGSSWRVKVYLDTVNGKKVFQSKSFKTEALAVAYAEMSKAVPRSISTQKRLIQDHRIINCIPQRFRDAVSKANYSSDEILLARMPANNMTGIYFLINNDKIRYVGQTVNIFHRLAQHKRNDKVFDSYAFIPCEKEQLNELEKTYLDLLMPEENKY